MSIGSRVGILPEVIADLTGSLGDRVRRVLPEPNIIAQPGGSLQEIRDTWGVTKEVMAGIFPILVGMGARCRRGPSLKAP